MGLTKDQILATNEVFMNLEMIAQRHEEVLKAFDEMMEPYKKAEDWDNPELVNIGKSKEEETEHFRDIVPTGAWKAYRAWFWSKKDGKDVTEMTDFLWDNEVADFVEILSKAGIREFRYFNQSTAAIANLYDFIECGCEIDSRALKEEEGFNNKPKYIKGFHILVPEFKEG